MVTTQTQTRPSKGVPDGLDRPILISLHCQSGLCVSATTRRRSAPATTTKTTRCRLTYRRPSQTESRRSGADSSLVQPCRCNLVQRLRVMTSYTPTRQSGRAALVHVHSYCGASSPPSCPILLSSLAVPLPSPRRTLSLYVRARGSNAAYGWACPTRPVMQ